MDLEIFCESWNTVTQNLDSRMIPSGYYPELSCVNAELISYEDFAYHYVSINNTVDLQLNTYVLIHWKFVAENLL